MSDILVIKYQFYKFAYGNFNNYLINRHYVDKNKVDVNSIEYTLLRDLKMNYQNIIVHMFLLLKKFDFANKY